MTDLPEIKTAASNIFPEMNYSIESLTFILKTHSSCSMKNQVRDFLKVSGKSLFKRTIASGRFGKLYSFLSQKDTHLLSFHL